MTILISLTLLSLLSCDEQLEDGRAADVAASVQPAPAETAVIGDAVEGAAATENATAALPPAFAQDGSLDASGSASEDVAPVISDDFLVPEADPERDLEGPDDSPDAHDTPDAAATLP